MPRDDLFGGVPPSRAFDGETYVPARDFIRLNGQMRRVYDVMKDGEWHSLQQLIERCGGTAASMSARLRDFRKRKYGARVVDRRHVSEGFFLYRFRRG